MKYGFLIKIGYKLKRKENKVGNNLTGFEPIILPWENKF